MSWDRKRNNGPVFYYRSQRIDGRTVKVYVGTGPQAEYAAREDEKRRQQRRARKEAWLDEMECVALADAALKDLCQIADLLRRTTLLLSWIPRTQRAVAKKEKMSWIDR